jgi:FkbM family methyltransferase
VISQLLNTIFYSCRFFDGFFEGLRLHSGQEALNSDSVDVAVEKIDILYMSRIRERLLADLVPSSLLHGLQSMGNFKSLILNAMGRQAAYRLGRSLYMQARGDIPNSMHSNGEELVQRCVVDALRQRAMGDTDAFVIFDVGANVGAWSEALFKMIPEELRGSVKVICFEPVPGTNATLRKNVSGRFDSLHVEDLALSSRTGFADIFVSDESNCGTNSLHQHSSAPCETTLAVPLITASSYCSNKGISHVHLFKCDTEGHDADVIRGALPLLENNHVSVLQFEYNHRWIGSGSFLKDIFEMIEDLPYALAKLQQDHLLVYPAWHHELEKFFEGNYALIHESSCHWFPLKYAQFDLSNSLVVRSESGT